MSYARGSNIAKHAWSSNHSIDFKNSQVIGQGSPCIRKTLESWHTASIDQADNNSRNYRSLINTPFFFFLVSPIFAYICSYCLFYFYPLKAVV